MLYPVMAVLISMLRGVNVAGRNMLPMDALRKLYESIGLRNAQTYIQSGNVVFKSNAQDGAAVTKKIEDTIEKKFGFRPAVTLRTAAELKEVLARNPFAKRRGLEASKLLITFFTMEPAVEMRSEILSLKAGNPEEIVIDGRELYIYFPNGMGRSEVWRGIDRALKKSGTGRNLNTVAKLLEMAERMETSR
jgi:uncharacterized protein (DUF1697 family)